MSSPHRRKGGVLHIEKKTVNVRYKGREHTITWFSGASDEAISRAIDKALGLPRKNPPIITITDPEDGSALTISDSIPDGLTLDAKAVAVSNVEGGALRGQDVNTSRSESPSDGRRPGNGPVGDAKNGKTAGAAAVFRVEMVKFQRLGAHLANERTWLAWIRTTSSGIGVALTILTLSEGLDAAYLDEVAMGVGVVFVVCMLFGFFTGLLRYVRTEEVLRWPELKKTQRFGVLDVKYVALFLYAAFILTVPIYIMGGVNVVMQT